jgi:hypothetical protein
VIDPPPAPPFDKGDKEPGGRDGGDCNRRPELRQPDQHRDADNEKRFRHKNEQAAAKWMQSRTMRNWRAEVAWVATAVNPSC